MSRRVVALLGALVLIALGLTVPTSSASSTSATVHAAAAPAAGSAWQASRTLQRVFVDADGVEQVQGSYDVTVRADQTEDLRGRQRVRISWSGAKPSGGRAANPFGLRGMQQEYPVVIMQCRGRDDASLPEAQQVRPETCWTSTFSQRSAVTKSTAVESTWLEDLYAEPEDKERVSGIEPFPAEECPAADVAGYATHLTAFAAATGTNYPACTSETMPPEANLDGALPAAEVAAFTDLDGNGSAQFEVRSNLENESLGCSSSVPCSIVVIPIVGLSCERPEGRSLSRIERECRLPGQWPAGESNFGNKGIDQAVGPSLWWSESNWRNRFSVPITFGLPPDVCNVLDQRPAVGFYGSELLAQAALQWAPAYCLNKRRFKFELNLTSDIAGYNLMETGQIPAAVVSSKQPAESDAPVGYAPTALTGFGIGYVVDKPDNAGDVTDLRLNARLIAKLLTQSYLGSDLGRRHPVIGDDPDDPDDPVNPLGIMADPEFTKLNPGLSTNPQEAGAALLNLSDSSDVVLQLTEYVAQDPTAMAFINGAPDENGMVVNPNYRGIELPRREWPLLDDYVPETEDPCRQEQDAIYFNQIASPVSRLRQIALAVLDGWPNIQTRCDFDPATGRYKTGRTDQQSFGSRFMLGVVSLGDAARFGIRVARLRTKGNEYVGATDAAIATAINTSTQSRPGQPFVLDQAQVARNGKAYPGAMIVYTAARTRGMDQESANDVASFIRISTSEGQVPGSGNGKLPAGYVPIRKNGPTAKLWASAQQVADAVEAQREPSSGGEEQPPGEETDGTDTDTDTDTDDGTSTPGSTDPGTIDPGTTDPGSVIPPGTVDPSAAPTDAASTEAPETLATTPTAATTAQSSGLMGKLFPILLVAGLLALAYVFGSRFFVRPPRRLT